MKVYTMELLIVNLKDCDEKYFRKAWELYENSFPSEEKRTINEQYIILEKENYFAKVFIKDEDIVGILFFWDFIHHTFIEHFAINSILRGQSYGSKILEDFLSKYKNCVLEIELIKDEITKKRFDFYNRFDFQINEHKHYQVPFRKNSKKLELLLLSHKNKLTKNEYQKLSTKMINSLTII